MRQTVGVEAAGTGLHASQPYSVSCCPNHDQCSCSGSAESLHANTNRDLPRSGGLLNRTSPC